MAQLSAKELAAMVFHHSQRQQVKKLRGATISSLQSSGRVKLLQHLKMLDRIDVEANARAQLRSESTATALDGVRELVGAVS